MLKNAIITSICLMIFSLLSHAQVLKANYDVSYGIFGQIGTANAVLEKTKKSYTIDIHLESTGLAYVLSNGRKERHISKGHMKKGLMVSDLYQVIRSYGETVISKEYYIDHRKKKVRKVYKKYKEGKLVVERNTMLDFYAQDDLLTLYFNLDALVKNKTQASTYHLEAVGAEKQKGKVTLMIPHENEVSWYHEELGKDSAWYATAVIHQKIFSSKEGRLLLGVDKDGITNQAVLKDVIFFGDIRGVRVK